jgi:hypothetical protein
VEIELIKSYRSVSRTALNVLYFHVDFSWGGPPSKGFTISGDEVSLLSLDSCLKRTVIRSPSGHHNVDGDWNIGESFSEHGPTTTVFNLANFKGFLIYPALYYVPTSLGYSTVTKSLDNHPT